MEKLGEIIRRCRKEKGLKGFQFARKLGIHPTYVTLIELYNKIPAPPLIRKIEKELGIDLKNIYLKETVPADFIPDATIRTPSSSYDIEFKQTRGRLNEKQMIAYYMSDFVFSSKDKSADKAAVALIKEFKPSKCSDSKLRGEIATFIKTLRIIYKKIS